MSESKKHDFIEKTNVLLLWKRGEEGSLLKNVDVKIFKDGVVQIRDHGNKEKLTCHISNVVIISKESPNLS